MTMLKIRSLFLLLFFQCCLGYAIEGEAVKNDYPTIQTIANLDTSISNASTTEETDLPIQKSPDHQPNNNKPLKSTKISGHETDGSWTNTTEDNINKTTGQSTNHTRTKISDHETDGITNFIEDITNKTTDRTTNHTKTMYSKIGVGGGKTGGSKIGGSKGGGSKTKIGGRGYNFRPSTRWGGDLMELWLFLGFFVVCGGGYLLFYLYAICQDRVLQRNRNNETKQYGLQEVNTVDSGNI